MLKKGSINADDFAHQEVLQQFRLDKMERGEPQLILIASDGSLYGHHQPFRGRFLGRLEDGAIFSENIDAIYANSDWIRSGTSGPIQP
jgi:hypothetical protein